MTNIVLPMTQAERERKELHDKVVSLYLGLRSKYPDASANRIFETISQNVGRTTQGVRDIIIKNNLYTPKSRTAL